MKSPPFHTSPYLAARHGFFTREGGISLPPYDSLNGGLITGDDPGYIAGNRQSMARILGVEAGQLMAMTQIHGPDVVTIQTGQPLWPMQNCPEADALVTSRPDIALSIATADCAPVLFSTMDGKIVGAAHAGWRGAVSGVLEQTIAAMRELGAEGINAVIGPCIGPDSYEVAADMREVVLRDPVLSGAGADRLEAFFVPAAKKGHYLFNLPGFCQWRLQQAGIADAAILAMDTLTDPRFFSYRRNTLSHSGPTGRQISAIRASG